MKNLNKRENKCSKCGMEKEHDLNASFYIVFEGICKYYKEKYSN